MHLCFQGNVYLKIDQRVLHMWGVDPVQISSNCTDQISLVIEDDDPEKVLTKSVLWIVQVELQEQLAAIIYQQMKDGLIQGDDLRYLDDDTVMISEFVQSAISSGRAHQCDIDYGGRSIIIKANQFENQVEIYYIISIKNNSYSIMAHRKLGHKLERED